MSHRVWINLNVALSIRVNSERPGVVTVWFADGDRAELCYEQGPGIPDERAIAERMLEWPAERGGWWPVPQWEGEK